MRPSAIYPDQYMSSSATFWETPISYFDTGSPGVERVAQVNGSHHERLDLRVNLTFEFRPTVFSELPLDLMSLEHECDMT